MNRSHTKPSPPTEPKDVCQPGARTPLQVGTGRLDVTNPPLGGSGVPKEPDYVSEQRFRAEVLRGIKAITERLEQLRRNQ